MSQYSCELRNSIVNVQHLPKRRCYKITLEVPADIGSKIMEYAAMLAGIRPWDESKVLLGGLVLTESPGEDMSLLDHPGCGAEQ